MYEHMQPSIPGAAPYLMQRVSLTLGADVLVHPRVGLHQAGLDAALPSPLPVLALHAGLRPRPLVLPDAQGQR